MLLSMLFACAGPVEPAPLSYHTDVRPILEARCLGCHAEGDIGPVPLETYEQVRDAADLVRWTIESGSMPPWQPAEGCADYADDRSLPDHERDLLLRWLDEGANEGDPADHNSEPAPSLDPDVWLELPEPYTPAGAPDDYRCFAVEWPLDKPAFVTGVAVEPDQRDLVHHLIAFHAGPEEAESYRALDSLDEGPGYDCFGGPAGESGGIAMQLASWAPGGVERSFPAGTGIAMEPGSVVILQLHYNVDDRAAAADQTTVGFVTADAVERPAAVQLVTDPLWMMPGGMAIPAGESVTHSSDIDLGLFSALLGLNDLVGLAPGDPIQLHSVGLHMHELGVSGRVSLQHEDGSETCLLDIPAWDFAWQGSYTLAQPITYAAGDRLRLRCTWDNSAPNQTGGSPPIDVEWGEGTGDEMCLTGLYMTAP